MNNFTFRVALKSDLESIAKLVHKLNLYHGDDYCPAAQDYERDWDHYELYVICDENNIIGFLAGNSDYKFHTASRRYLIQNIFIHEQYRNKGAARMLFEKVIALKYEEGIERFALGVDQDNDVARSFYESIGFQACPMHDIRYVLKGDDLQRLIAKCD